MRITWRNTQREEFDASNLDDVISSVIDNTNACNVVLNLAQSGEAARLRGYHMAPENDHVNLVS
jgi:hypothetical protein